MQVERLLTKIAQVAIFCIAVSFFVGCIWRIFGFFALGHNHPLNSVFYYLGVSKRIPNMEQLSFFSPFEMFASCVSVITIYLLLAHVLLHIMGWAATRISMPKPVDTDEPQQP